MGALNGPIQIFMCYARKDEPLLRELKKQLKILQRQGFIEVWHDREISPGANWKEEIEKHLNTANIILLLVSSDFMDSEYCYSVEMKRAMERHQAGKVRVIPVIVQPTLWQSDLFGKLQALPTDGKAVTGPSWHSLDEAFLDVAEGIRKTVMELRSNIPDNKQIHLFDQPSNIFGNKQIHSFEQFWEEALQAERRGEYEQAFRLLQASLKIQNLTSTQRKAARSRILSLRQLVPNFLKRARIASLRGDLKKEIQAWEDLKALEPSKQEISGQLTFSSVWDNKESDIQSIQERLDIAQQYQQWDWAYKMARELISKQQNEEAVDQLEILWREAPFYGDPAGLAQIVGLPPARTYEQALADELARQQQQIKAATREYQKKQQIEAIERAKEEDKQERQRIKSEQDEKRRAIAAEISAGTGVGCLAGMLLAPLLWVWEILTPQGAPERAVVGHSVVSGLERVLFLFGSFPGWISGIMAGVLVGLTVGAGVGCIEAKLNSYPFFKGRIAGGIVGFFAGLVILGIIGETIGGDLLAGIFFILGSYGSIRMGAEIGESIGEKWLLK